MPIGTRAEQPSAVTASLRRNRLGVISVTSFVVAAVSVLLVQSGLVTTFLGATGITSAPLFFIVVALVLLVFGPGYLAMSTRIKNAGAFYAFVTQGLGRPAGVGASLVALLAYNALQIALYGAFGAFAGQYASLWFGITVPWYLSALIALAIVAVLGVRDIGFSGRVAVWLSGIEILVSFVIPMFGIASPAPASLVSGLVGAAGSAGLAWSTLSLSALWHVGSWGGLVLAGTGFVGFEVGPVYVEEARRPRRAVAVSLYVVVIGSAIVYAFGAFALATHWGVEQVAYVSQTLGPDAVFDMAPTGLANSGRSLLLTSILIAMVAFHNGVTRYAFSLARDGILPSKFSQAGRRHRAPWLASLVQSSLALVVIAVYAAMHWDPLVQLFLWGGTTGGFGIMGLLALTSASVVGFFARDRHGESAWRRIYAPVISGLALAAIVAGAAYGYSDLLGGTAGPLTAKLLPASMGAVFVIGLIIGLVLRARKRAVYDRIGQGGQEESGLPTGYQPTSVRVA